MASDVAPIRIPDDWTVWAATDLHGQARAVDRLLVRAGLMDEGGRWIAPERTALVVTGDVVDRGPDTLGLVRRLAALRERAPDRGGRVALLQGNHELQVLGGLAGEPQLFRALLAFGGGATLASVGLRPEDWADAPPDEIAARVDALAPDLVPTLWSFAPYARWGDVLLVHAGPVPDQPLDAYARRADRLWIRGRFFASPDRFPDGDGWAPYRAAGLRRVVYGHTPVDVPALTHDGRALNLDTWKGRLVTLAGLEPGAPLGEATFLHEAAEPRSTDDAPISDDEVRELDRTLPGRVDAWLASIREPGGEATQAGASTASTV